MLARTMTIWIFIIPSLLLLECEGARILAFLPAPLHSHQNTFRPIFRGLAKNGHDVTVVTSLPDKNTLYKQIDVSSSEFDETFQNIDLYGMRSMSWFGDMVVVAKFFEDTMHIVLKNPEVQKLIHSSDVQFDLVITESTMGQEAFAALGHKFKTPVIEIQALVPTFWLYHLIGNPYYFSHSVTYYTHSTDKMNFMERLKNTIMGATTLMMRRYYSLPRQEAMVERYFKYPGWETRPPLMDLLSNISLVLQNTHIATHYPHPYNPNVIEIAGVQLQEPTKLPQDLQTYLDNSVDGFIYFSFGSAVQGSMMPENTKQAFLSAFRKIPNKVLWKWETETLPNKPSNVKISKWFPQAGVLAHPNLKVFVTHGGLASMTESLYHGVPLLLIPMFVDQLKNSKQIEAAGSGIVLDFDNITEASVSWSLEKLFTDPSYRKAAQRQSRILRDNPLPPVDRAVYWIEYVLRHNGAPHLRTAAVTLPWYKYFLIDVIAALLVSVIFVTLVIYFLIRTLYRLLFARSKKIVQNQITKRKNK